ncbi:S-adenosyl-L-methionine-dependent methyltransferase [Peniophora sp. CONT]|nr:S-adenosyl-L-methionine-dependent methyltransferase [Peniophora sp. CONT]
MDADESSDFEPSRLGTKEHWDSVYAREVDNFEETGDEGEVWFGEDAVEKMVDWAQENVPPSSEPYILEVGAGNATLLLALVDAGYTASRAAAIDYSPDAIRLARLVAEQREHPDIVVAECDFLAQDPPLGVGQKDGWDLLLDKGTYDAIALGDKDENGLTPAAKYPPRAAAILKPGGYFLITSCNFTEEELKRSFATPETGLVYHSRVQHPVISFGGKSGSVYATVAFQKPQ